MRILTSLNSSSSFRCSIASFSALFLCSFSTFSYFFQYSSIWWEMKINVLLAFTVLLLIIKTFQEKMKCSTYQNLTSVWHLRVQSNWLVSFLHWNLLLRARSSLLVTCTDLHVHLVLQKVKLFQSVFRERQIKNRKVTFSCFLKAIAGVFQGVQLENSGQVCTETWTRMMRLRALLYWCPYLSTKSSGFRCSL